MNVINWLQRIPVEVRAYIYRVVTLIAGLSFITSRFSAGTVSTVLEVLAVVLAIPASGLAAANTPTLRALRKRA